MISHSPTFLRVAGARTGVAPAHLLDVQDVNGNLYYWSDRKIVAPIAITQSELQSVPATPPTDIAAGQQVAWALPTEVQQGATGGAGTVNATLTDAFLTITNGGPFLGVQSWAQWSGFQMPKLPAGAVIDAVYAVVIAESGGEGVASSIADSGPSLAIDNLPSDGGSEALFNLTADVDGQYAGGSLGNTESAVTTAKIGCALWMTLSGTVFQDMTVSFIGLAIYYTWPPTGGGGGSGVTPTLQAGSGQYEPWLLGVPEFTFNRSLKTDTGSFVIQNVSGDTLSRDVEKILRASAFEGAFFIYRLWQADAQEAWLEVHGTLTFGGSGVDTVTYGSMQLLNPAQEDTPLEIYCETCQLQWGGKRCGSTQSTECEYSFETCQVVERPMMVLNNFEKNYGEAVANTAFNVINRRRTI